MPDPMGALRKYTLEVANWLRGDGPATHLPQQPSFYPVPAIGVATQGVVPNRPGNAPFEQQS
jgi:hypothetical protein